MSRDCAGRVVSCRVEAQRQREALHRTPRGHALQHRRRLQLHADPPRRHDVPRRRRRRDRRLVGLGEQRGVEHDEDVQRHAHRGDRGNRGNRLDRVLCDQRAEQADLGAARYNIDVIERKPCKGRHTRNSKTGY